MSTTNVADRFRTDAKTLGAYVSDASIYRRSPSAVFEPRSIEDLREAVLEAGQRQWSITVRGGGTSVAGNAMGEGLIIDTSRHFNHILEVDGDARTARVQPGVVCDDLRAEAGKFGLTYGPDPSTHSRCTIGGMIANNACGSHSLQWGTSADNLLELTIMRADGSLVTLSSGGSSDPDLDRDLAQMRDDDLATYRTELGRFPRQVSGYGLHYLSPENGFDIAKAFAGTEGTCGIIVEAQVRLVERPAATALAVAAFATIFDAAAASPTVRQTGISTAEGMGGDLLDALEESQGNTNAAQLLPGIDGDRRSAGGWLYCEATGDTPEEAEARAQRLLNDLSSRTDHAPIDSIIVTDAGEMRRLWTIRESAAGLVTRLPDGREAWPSWEDSAVPVENLAAYLHDLYALLEKHRLEGIPFGHFGEGCIHIRISFDLATDTGVSAFEAFMRDAADTVAAHGGSLSGEHGDGRARSALLDRMYSPRALSAFSRFKSIMDPAGLFNPGVLVDPDSVTEQVRVGSEQRNNVFIPVHALSRDGGSIVNAVNRCVGVGLCRSEADAMCPSFQITGDEVHSTRGRARVLSEMFRGDLYPGGTNSEEVKDALDLCLSCHACASECPVNVDMSVYKSEFLHQHYSERRRPMAHYSMGWLPFSSYLLHRVPGAARLTNLLLRFKPLTRLVMRLGGVEQDREMIRFSSQSFQSKSRTRKRTEPSEVPKRKRVVLWPDSFTNHLDVGVADDAQAVLEALGYEVVVPSGFICCGLTWHSTGQLDTARRIIRNTLDRVGDYLDGNTPVVCLEPSCASMLTEEGPELLNDDPRVHQLAQQVTTLGEFVADYEATEPIETWPFDTIPGSALSQVHCHERSRKAHGGTERVLERIGIDEDTIETGCCGLAGNWGFEPGHGEMSRSLGERELFPRIRALEPATPVLADGFSCRTQIREGTGTEGLHLATLLRSRLK